MSKDTRDDFSGPTKRQLALRVSHVCSLAKCNAHTCGPSDEANDAVTNVGVAAHITAAAPGGPRYDASMDPEQRSSIENGIWLCQSCSKEIDDDVATWTVEKLRAEKAEAERRTKEWIGKTRLLTANGIEIEGAVCVYVKSYRAAYVALMLVNRGDSQSIKSVRLTLGDSLLVPNRARENFGLNGLEWLAPPPMRLERNEAKMGAWFFGWSFGSGGQHVEAIPGAKAHLRIEPVNGPAVEADLQFIHPDDASAPAAPAVAIPTLSEHREHDKALFQKLNALMPEVALVQLLDRLQTSDDYRDSDIAPCDSFLSAMKLQENRFCDDALNDAAEALARALRVLVVFLARRFFVYPESQRGSDLRYALDPELNVDRGGRFDAEAGAAYAKLCGELDENATAARKAYSAYRRAVRMTLAI